MIFCVRQLQEKTRKQQMPLHGPLWISQNKEATDATPRAFVDLTKQEATDATLRAFVDLTKQGSNRCHSTGLCGSHKTREQQMSLHVAFVDLTKAFDYVNREALFTILKKVGSPPILLDLIKSFHEKTCKALPKLMK